MRDGASSPSVHRRPGRHRIFSAEPDRPEKPARAAEARGVPSPRTDRGRNLGRRAPGHPVKSADPRMFSHQFYNLVHIVGILLLMVGLGGIATMTAGTPGVRAAGSRRSVMALHVAGLFLILLGGFGMLARLGIVHGTSWPGWIWAKVIIWLTLGAVAALPYRFPRAARPLLLVVPVLGGLAAYMAIYKPL